jgi:phosphatidylserine/phosphatidylglycerophosphate/cardiolipin synthase-like enzyme
MSTTATGSVINESGNGISGLDVLIEDTSRLLPVLLNQTATNGSGQFSLSYLADLDLSSDPGKQPRQLRLRIQLGQHILKEIPHFDTPGGTLDFGNIQVDAAEATSWWATLGTGQPSRLTHGNAIRWLVDNEDAWGRVEDVIDKAGTLDVMQLEIDVDEFKADILDETPRLVLRFDPDRETRGDLSHGLDRKDLRIERAMLKAAQRGVDVRMQIPRMTTDPTGVVVISALLGAVIGLLIIFLLGSTIAALLTAAGIIGGAQLAKWLLADRKFLADTFGKRDLEKWFKDAIADIQQHPPLPANLGTVRVAELRLRSTFVTHAKMVIDRNVEAILLGSPFTQVYFDSLHRLDDDRRGREASKGPIHDVSVGVRGPSVGHLQELFNSHWNIAEPTDKLPETPPLPAAPQSLNDGEILSSAQVVRTLDSMFTPGGDGEKGVLEAYTRAIHHAERFIYCENQYFTDDAIIEALIGALRKKPKVQVILLLNATPDMPLYLGWQLSGIKRIRESFSSATDAAQRFGVFSTWTHEVSATDPTDMGILDNYLHTKTAIVDNRWATVGSANLDGASLDYVQYLRGILSSDLRNTETNIVVFDESSTQSSAADALRRRLWAEHLGYVNAKGEPVVTDPELADAENKDWLALWRTRATQKRDALKQNLANVMPCRVLEWPADDLVTTLGRCRFLQLARDHALAIPYLRKTLTPTQIPDDDIRTDGPEGREFFYGANPGTEPT